MRGSLMCLTWANPRAGNQVELSIGPYHKALLMMTRNWCACAKRGLGQELSARIKAREEELDAELNRF